MRVFLLSVMVFSASGATFAAAQSVDEAALKAVVDAQAKAWIERKPEASQALWVHDEKASRAVVDSGSYTFTQGSEKIGANGQKDAKQNPEPLNFTATTKNFVARQDGNLAFVEFDQTLTGPGIVGTGLSHEYRVLVRDGGQWKIASQITHVTASYESAEGIVNGAGYGLLQKGKPEEAIELFKANVHAYPQSWNAYDSLGEAYVSAGQKDLAIQNYQKSLELNPKNESGRQALAKLKSP